MSQQLLDLLKLGLLALLYLFFLRVIWAVWTELRTPVVAARPGGGRQSRGPSSAGDRTTTRRVAGKLPKVLKAIEPAEARGTEYALVSEMTLGRAPGCTVVVDDTYVSQVHARVFAQDDGYKLEDLGSTNGTFHNGTPVLAPQPLKLGDRVQVGELVLEVS